MWGCGVLGLMMLGLWEKEEEEEEEEEDGEGEGGGREGGGRDEVATHPGQPSQVGRRGAWGEKEVHTLSCYPRKKEERGALSYHEQARCR